MSENQNTTIMNATVWLVRAAKATLIIFVVVGASLGFSSAFFEWPISDKYMVAGFRAMIYLFVGAIMVALVATILSILYSWRYSNE